MLGRKVTILMYHGVNPTPDRYSVSPEQFARQLDFIKDRYRTAALRDIEPALRTAKDRTVIFTFDDAFVDFAEFAYPLLESRGIPCTLFVPTGHVGGWNAWDQNRLGIHRKRIMTAAQLQDISRDGLMDIGSHGVDHLSMGRLTRTEMGKQAGDSRRALEDMLSRPVKMFAYPYGGYGDFTPETEAVLRESGYDLAVTTRWGSRNSLDDIFRLRRMSFGNATSLASVRARIEGLYDWKDLRDRAQLALRARRQAKRRRLS